MQGPDAVIALDAKERDGTQVHPNQSARCPATNWQRRKQGESRPPASGRPEDTRGGDVIIALRVVVVLIQEGGGGGGERSLAKAAAVLRGAVAEWLAHSPPTMANRVQSPTGSLPDFCKWGSCRTRGFSRGSPVSPGLAFRRCSIFTSVHPHRLIGYKTPVFPNTFIHFPRKNVGLGDANRTAAYPAEGTQAAKRHTSSEFDSSLVAPRGRSGSVDRAIPSAAVMAQRIERFQVGPQWLSGESDCKWGLSGSVDIAIPKAQGEITEYLSVDNHGHRTEQYISCRVPEFSTVVECALTVTWMTIRLDERSGERAGKGRSVAWWQFSNRRTMCVTYCYKGSHAGAEDRGQQHAPTPPRCNVKARAGLESVDTPYHNSRFWGGGVHGVERLAYSPPTKANRVQSPTGSLQIFACGNRAGRCRWSPGFLGDLPFPAPLHPGAAPYSPQLPSPTLKTSMLSALLTETFSVKSLFTLKRVS
ncbi:hypothetical protein PR048_009534, partial [Dryococelus australis]